MYEEQTPGEAGAGVGDPERFSQVLREAIAGSGLTLAAISRTLRRRDLPASPATLSSWQSGARHPDWERSREVLEALEEVVKIEPGTLSSLVVQRRRRGRPPERGDLAKLMPPGTSAVREALVELGFRTPEDFPMEQTIVEHALVDTDASTLEMTFLTQVKATTDGICALPSVHLLETAGGPDVPQIGALGGCRVARRVSKFRPRVCGRDLELGGLNRAVPGHCRSAHRVCAVGSKSAGTTGISGAAESTRTNSPRSADSSALSITSSTW